MDSCHVDGNGRVTGVLTTKVPSRNVCTDNKDRKGMTRAKADQHPAYSFIRVSVGWNQKGSESGCAASGVHYSNRGELEDRFLRLVTLSWLRLVFCGFVPSYRASV